MQSIEKKRFKFTEIYEKGDENRSLTYWKILNKKAKRLCKRLILIVLSDKTAYRPCSKIIRIETRITQVGKFRHPGTYRPCSKIIRIETPNTCKTMTSLTLLTDHVPK